MMTMPRALLILPLIGLALAACGPDAAKGVGAASAESHAPGTTLAMVPGSCAAYPKGAPGVINTFCNGPAKVTVNVNGKPHSLTGGTCVANAAARTFTLNLGVLGTRELAGPRPDYIGLTAPTDQGPFSGAALVVNLDGKAYVVRGNSGVVGPTGGTFSGTARHGRKIEGSFSC